MAISYQEASGKSKLRHKRPLSMFLKELFREYNLGTQRMSVTYVFCNDDYLLRINQQYLNHDTLTDIITFDLSEHRDELVAEIYISTERVAENAGSFGVSYQQELHRVIFHGALHLCGLKDKTKSQQEAMRRAENECLTQYAAIQPL